MRGLGIILSGVLGTGVTLAGSAGYLPRAGPVLLRFQPPRSVPQVTLPPLQMHDDPPQLTLTPDTAFSQVAEPGPVTSVSGAAEPSTVRTNLLNQALTSSPSPDFNSEDDLPNQGLTNSSEPSPDLNKEGTGLLSPQMLLRFFTPAGIQAGSPAGKGAGREVLVAVPPGFNPARPGQSASSSATYTGPKP